MASITSAGIGSGLDVTGIVQQLLAAEAAPVETRLGQQEARAQSKLSAFGTLQAALAEFRDAVGKMTTPTSLSVRKASSTLESLFSVTIQQSAVPAEYSVEVERLAEAHRLTSGAFASEDSEIGTGTLTVGLGASTFDVDIAAPDNTLIAIQDAINNAPDNVGVAATIVNADSGSHLILTGVKTGLSNTITVNQSGGDGGLSVLEYDPGAGLNSLTETTAAQDSLIRIDGLDVQHETNSIDGAISGVTLDLNATNPGNPGQLKIENDTEAVSQLVTDFVEKYNALVEIFTELTDYDEENEVGGPLIGDAAIRSIQEQLRREFSTPLSDPNLLYSSLNEIGITTELDGSISLDDAKLADNLGAEFSQVGKLFTDTAGFGNRLFDLVEGFLAVDGIIETKTSGLTSRIEGITDQREALGERLASLETRLLRQFNALDSLISQLSSTSDFLSQQLDNLPGFVRNDRSG